MVNSSVAPTNTYFGQMFGFPHDSFYPIYSFHVSIVFTKNIRTIHLKVLLRALVVAAKVDSK